MQAKKFIVPALLLALLAFAIPYEHKYDKFFRFFSLTLIPNGLQVPDSYDKKIYFYFSDLAAVALLGMALFWHRIPLRQFFFNRCSASLWIIFLCALISIIASPFAHYPIPYFRLIQLLTPILLFSFISQAFTGEKIARWIFTAIILAAVLQSGIAIAQYFKQGALGLRLIGELPVVCNQEIFAGFCSRDGSRWIFDSIFHRISSTTNILRAYGTFPHPNVLGGFIALAILCAYPMMYASKKILLWLGLCMPFLFFALLITYSRAALFSWALGSLVWYGFLFFKNGWRDRSLRSLTWIIALSFLAPFSLLLPQITSRGGVVSSQFSQGSDQIRWTHLNVALKMIESHPWTGVGFSQSAARSPDFLPADVDPSNCQTTVHNIYLFLASETGLISLAAFLFFLASLFFAGLRAETTPYSASLLAIFAAFLFIGLFDFYPIFFQQGKLMFFSMAGVMAANAKRPLQFRNTPMPKSPSRSEIWKMFDLISPTYDRINRILSLGMDQSWRKKLVRYLPKRSDLKILDLATGTGDQLLAFLKGGVSIESAAGIDLSSEMLRLAEKKLADYPCVQLLKADAEKLPFPDSHFDAASFSFGIRNVTDPLRSLSEIHRVLKPAGCCLILEFSLPPQPIRFFHLFYLRRVLPRIGAFLSRNKNAYRYLNETIETFPSGKAFCSLLEKAAFKKVAAHPMSLGAVTLYVGEKCQKE